MYLSYTYFIKNKVTEQFYYGSRYRNVKLQRHPEDDLWIYYFTSSRKIKSLIATYGKESFEFKVISKSVEYDSCYWYEQSLIEQSIGNPLCLNMHYTRSGKVKFLRAGIPISDSTKVKMSIVKKGIPHTEEHRHNVSMALLKKYNTPTSVYQPKRKRKEATAETKTKMSLANLERIKKECQYCGNYFDPGNYARYHGDNCKHKL